ncbi:response regulator transcription factor [Undibacterium crateris]|uniref:response regulator transcription factor n=1 Tax=Undibacterium crateris TaxID=2528175 RepID=UPI0013895D08|nr:response regulator [Undibacterium crateris]NDI85986.1 response regulator [Undibacterium crateris]
MQTSLPPIVHVVDDDSSVRSALGILLQACGFRVSTYESGAHFFQADLPAEVSCILLDVNMPGLSGLEVQEFLNKRQCPVPVIFLTAYGDISMSVRAIKAGAEDFLSKPVQKEDLLKAVNAAHQRYEEAHQSRVQLEDLRYRYSLLTERELEVFHLVVRGKLNKQIAYELGNSERTIKAQRSSVMEKMQVETLAELVLRATQLGVFDQGKS